MSGRQPPERISWLVYRAGEQGERRRLCAKPNLLCPDDHNSTQPDPGESTSGVTMGRFLHLAIRTEVGWVYGFQWGRLVNDPHWERIEQYCM